MVTQHLQKLNTANKFQLFDSHDTAAHRIACRFALQNSGYPGNLQKPQEEITTQHIRTFLVSKLLRS